MKRQIKVVMFWYINSNNKVTIIKNFVFNFVDSNLNIFNLAPIILENIKKTVLI